MTSPLTAPTDQWTLGAPGASAVGPIAVQRRPEGDLAVVSRHTVVEIPLENDLVGRREASRDREFRGENR